MKTWCGWRRRWHCLVGLCGGVPTLQCLVGPSCPRGVVLESSQEQTAGSRESIFAVIGSACVSYYLLLLLTLLVHDAILKARFMFGAQMDGWIDRLRGWVVKKGILWGFGSVGGTLLSGLLCVLRQSW
ncbi:uncharacterized protein IWZ02DRAFT_192312 [Phyllosticta citriasiana]|uniref:uncharacterized protein n=1 Tax=Phyllosticta citriasiana TaxID=595635 RepID=UPI0030FD44ED